MDEYHVTFAKSATRELRGLDPQIGRRVLAVVEKLSLNPRPPGCAKLTGSVNEWRIRTGDWRVIYTVDDAAGAVDIIAIAERIRSMLGGGSQADVL
jgi:mRNA interferase RelE/StbE